MVVSRRRDEQFTSETWKQDAVVLGYDIHGKPWHWPDRVRVMQGIVLGMILICYEQVGRNYVARCPACADSGHDRSGDNLAILIEDSRFYKCWAGCTRETIRAALGHPVRVRHTA